MKGLLSAFGGAAPDKPLAGTAQGSAVAAAAGPKTFGGALAARLPTKGLGAAGGGLTRGAPGLVGAAPSLAQAQPLLGRPTAMRVARSMRGGKR